MQSIIYHVREKPIIDGVVSATKNTPFANTSLGSGTTRTRTTGFCNLGNKLEVYDAELHAMEEGLRQVQAEPVIP